MTSPSLRLGSAWYPELGDPKSIEFDLGKMRELGFNTVRIGDFAWSHLEPEDGRFTTDWLGRILDLALAHGIGVVLCTPTAGPPAWLLGAHPEIAWITREGYRHGVGGRQAADYCHSLFQGYSRRITNVLSTTFGRHPALIGWQIDNEFAGHQKVSLSPAALDWWHAWLATQYGTIDQLNEAWGSDVWGNRYSNFAAVPGPHPLPTYCHNHSLLTAYRRCMQDAVFAFQRQQTTIIRAHSSAPITHNSEDSVDEWDLTRDLDFAALDCYTHLVPLERVVFRLDCQRTLKPGRPFWLMETSAEGELADGPFPGAWLSNIALLAYASGAGGISYWPWRTNRTGAEICDHDGLLHSCGLPTTAWKPAQAVATLRTRLEGILDRFRPAPAPTACIRADRHGNAYYVERIAGLEQNFNYHAHVEAHYQDIAALGAWRDVLPDQAPVAGYRLVISPYLPYTTQDFLNRMQDHLTSGGTWVVGPYTGYLTKDHTNPMNGLLGDLGVQLALDVQAWARAKQVPVHLADGTSTTTLMRAHGFISAPGDEVLGTYGGDHLAGLAWGLRRHVGKGTLIVLGSEIGATARRDLYRQILDHAGIPRHPVPHGVVRIPQVDAAGLQAWALVNTHRTARTVVLPAHGHDLLRGTATGLSLEMPGNSNAFIVFEESVSG